MRSTLTIDNKIATSIGYFVASQQPDGAFLNPAAVNDDAYLAAIRSIQGVTSDPLTAEHAISNIAHAVAAHDLNLIQPVGVKQDISLDVGKTGFEYSCGQNAGSDRHDQR